MLVVLNLDKDGQRDSEYFSLNRHLASSQMIEAEAGQQSGKLSSFDLLQCAHKTLLQRRAAVKK